MRTVCAWCQKVLREGSPPTSHGLCEVCAVKWLVDAGMTPTNVRTN